MKYKNKMKGSLAVILAMILAVLTGGMPAFASNLTDNGIDPNQQGSITMTVNQDEWYVDGSIFRIYKVADLNGNFSFSYTDKFKNCDIGVDKIQPTGDSKNTASQWMELSTKFIGFVRQQGIEADDAKAIHNRQVTFTGLSLGLYLIQGDTAREGNRTVTYQPVVICIPQRASTSEAWKYDITAQVKTADPEYAGNPTNTPDNPNPTATPTPSGTVTGTPTPGPGTNETPTPTEKPGEPTNPGTNPSTTPGITGTSGGGNTPGNHNSTTPRPTRPSGGNSSNINSPSATLRRLLGVKTGDTTKVIVYAVIMAAAAGALIGVLAVRKHKSK